MPENKVFGQAGGAHLWFISVIFLCYLITPLLQRYKSKLGIIVLVMILSGYGLCYLSHTGGMTILYTSVYAIGYLLKNEEKEITMLLAIMVIILSLVVRLVSIKYFDGTVLYDCLLVYLTHTALAMGLFYLGKQIFMFKSNKGIDWLDSISYFVYITHYMFMVGPIRTMGLTSNLLINTVITMVLSFVAAIILQTIYKMIFKKNVI